MSEPIGSSTIDSKLDVKTFRCGTFQKNFDGNWLNVGLNINLEVFVVAFDVS